eukprot:TRINITY_DN17069_c0_g1_i1.p1 TRINITY_DN17069_c0_g1~~TRINITY_DN17069_c0_g1_i1.p1  ORF type:complete len:217 (-),score=68.45 TRINITY_DN17069_c0_g1_i1:71-721(-)
MASEDASAMYRKAMSLKAELEKELEGFAGKKSGEASVAVQQRLGFQASEFEKLVKGVRHAVEAMPDKGRAMWDRRAANLEEDYTSIQSSIEKQCGHYFRAKKEEDDRKALFGDQERKKGADDEMSGLLNERNSLNKSSAMLDDALDQGKAILGNLVDQNKVLKGARRKLLDAANVMGISASLVSVIDRRQKGDKWLIYGGMVLTLFVLFSLWYLLR